MLTRRTAIALTTAATLMPAAASAQERWPTKLVRVVIGSAAGSSVDVPVRALCQRLSERLGVAFVVENKVGAAGTIAALDVLRRLGAELRECRVQPLGSYYDVKIIIAESEIFSVHHRNLVARPKDFGADFRARTLPSVLFTASDYVQASREHRRMMLEMEPLYA